MPKPPKVPARFMRRLKTLVARQAAIRDQFRLLQGEIEDYLNDNEEAAEHLEAAVDALSKLA